MQQLARVIVQDVAVAIWSRLLVDHLHASTEGPRARRSNRDPNTTLRSPRASMKNARARGLALAQSILKCYRNISEYFLFWPSPLWSQLIFLSNSGSPPPELRTTIRRLGCRSNVPAAIRRMQLSVTAASA